MSSSQSSSSRSYAVVKFLSDSTFSEVPVNWISKIGDTAYCWWPPRSSNNAMLIANCVNPNYKLWHNFEVEVIKYCSSLESARKSAADGSYNTTDEDRCGRGKRQHVPYQPYSSDDELKNTKYRQLKNFIICPFYYYMDNDDVNNDDYDGDDEEDVEDKSARKEDEELDDQDIQDDDVEDDVKRARKE